MEFKHYSVMLSETVDALNVKDGGIYADGTLGGGGHSYEILSRSDNIRLIGIDQDQDAHKAASERLSKFGDKVTFVKDNFKNISKISLPTTIGANGSTLFDTCVLLKYVSYF